jgi:sulfite reductase beta subunit-like hemoprotein
MYRYDEFDHAFVSERVAEFKDQVERRLAGQLTEDEFRPCAFATGSTSNSAYMLRIAIPYGVLSPSNSASSPRSVAASTAATAISPRGRICSSTG